VSSYIPYLIVGITIGSLYGLAAMGLVLTYKTSGLFNLAYGSVSAAAAYVFLWLDQRKDLPWVLAMLIVLLVFCPLAAVLLERISTFLAPAATVDKIVATVGLLIAIVALVQYSFGSQALQFQSFLPQEEVFSVDGTSVTWDHVVDISVGVGAAIAFTWMFRRARIGVAMRAVVDDPQLLAMTGYAPTTVRLVSWLIGTGFAALSGILFASAQRQLDINIMTLIVVQAFGAAAIGRFTSLPLAFLGGIAIGLLQAIASKEVASHTSLSGIDTNVPFFVLFGILLISRRGQLQEVGTTIANRVSLATPLPLPARRVGVALLFVAAIALPHVVGSKLPAWNAAVTQAVLFTSLALLIRTSGQISLCHVGFAAIGAAGFAHALDDGMPWGVAVLIGAAWCVPAAAIIAIPAIRLSGLYLGLATLGFGVLLSGYAYTKSWFFGGGAQTRRPEAFDLDTNDTRYYYLLLVIALASLAVVSLIERARLGRLLRGLSDEPVALSTLGTNINITRVLVFVISGAMAGVAGATYSSLYGYTSPDTFPFLQSLVVVAVLVICGRSTILCATLGPILVYVLPVYIDNQRGYFLVQVAFGVAAILVAGTSRGQVSAAAARYAAASRQRLWGPAGTRMALARRRRAVGAT
jgi:branched-subunit amino acid ABC-type transport system permease component